MDRSLERAASYLNQLSKDMNQTESKSFFTNIMYYCSDRRTTKQFWWFKGGDVK